MSATKLGLYELLAPQFLAGFTFPDHVDRYLSVLGVDELRMGHDDNGVVYTGRVSFNGAAGALPARQHRDPSGAVFDWKDVTLDFRLTIPRDGAAPIDTAVQSAAIVSTALKDLFDELGPVEQTPAASTDYPGIRFRLELLFSFLTFHMGESWKPGMVAPDRRVVPDPALAGQDVRFVLPKLVFEYEQGDDLSKAPTFRLKSWGNSGFDAPADLDEGELVRMEPPLAVHESGRVAFGVDQVIVDLSPDHTPPEILQFFGTDEAFEGLYVKSARVFYSDKDKDLAINVGVKDVLVSFKGEVSLEASVDVLTNSPLTLFNVEVKIFDGPKEVQFTKGKAPDASHPNTLAGAAATVPPTAVAQVHITGGFPTYTVSAKLDGTELWDGKQAPVSPGAPGTLRPAGDYTLIVTVTDSAPTPNRFTQTIALTVKGAASSSPDGAPADRPRDLSELPGAVFAITGSSPASLPAGYNVSHSPSTSGISETLSIRGPSPTVTIGGVAKPVGADGTVTFDVAEGTDASPIAIAVSLPPSPATTETFHLLFDLNKPDRDHWPASKTSYVNGTPNPADSQFLSSRSPSGTSTTAGADALREWATNTVVSSPKAVDVSAFASFERDENEARDQGLSERRMEIAQAIVGSLAAVTTTPPQGHDPAKAAGRSNDPQDRAALITGEVTVASPAVTINATVSRKKRAPVVTPPLPQPPPAPPALPDRKPTIFKRISMRVRLERNVIVLGEISGEFDFETDIEKRLREQTTPTHDSDKLQLKQKPGASANPNPQDGVVDFSLTVIYDTSTHFLTETLFLGAHPNDVDGLLRAENPRLGNVSTSQNRFYDILGALLVFTPVLTNATAALADGQAGGWVEMGVGLGVPITLGALDVFQTHAITLFGGSLQLRQAIAPGQEIDFTDAGVILDYAVEFGIVISQLGISTTRNLKVRYRAVGFNFHFVNGVTFQPIFDTSKGYEIDLSDPGLFKLPGALGDLLKILAARIARFNPLTLELDLGMKVDLGVVSVDRFKVKWPLDPLGIPMILPSGVSVDIPATIVGSGYVSILDNGFEGQLDVSLVALKLRIAASLGVQNIEDAATGRKATAVFLGLIVEFPAPIPLAQSGLGIFGFSGLFAMHYKRDERPRAPGDSVSPALRWLERAGGDPAQLVRGADKLWVPEMDRWSFGIGIILGTVEGGFLMNFRGMFVLELPGPRILIFVKVQVITPLPGPKDANLTVGILGVIDIDFNLAQITVGVLIDLEIKKLIQVRVPVEIFFKISQPRLFHLYLGTIQEPATALVLNLVRARGYFMVDGDKIDNFPGPNGDITLPGIAVATGIEASVIFGNEDIGLYLKVAAGANLGIAFSPFFIAGSIFLKGELRLFIVSVGADGTLSLEAPDPTIIQGKICGHVSFFFFSVSGCVRVTIGSGTHNLPAPPLVRNVYLQSHSPAISSGQATDRPVDASLGDAIALPLPPGAELPVVPVDTVPVLQFHASPIVTGATTFTTPLATSPGLTPDGWVDVGGGRQVRYRLTSIELNPGVTIPPGAGLPPATWRRDPPPGPQGANTNVDLALFDRAPTPSERALERSTDLHNQVVYRWGDLCKKVAPPACVLWTFCDQPIGPSGVGWTLHGGPQPDPPGSSRSTPPPTTLIVEEPSVDQADELLNELLVDAASPFDVPAKVIGLPGGGGGRTGETRCVTFNALTAGKGKNPLTLQSVVFTVFDSKGKRLPQWQLRKVTIGKKSAMALDCAFRLGIVPPAPATEVQLTMVYASRPARADAFDAAGTLVGRAVMTVKPGVAETLKIAAKGIAKVVVVAAADETALLKFCYVTTKAGAGVEIPDAPTLALPALSGDARTDRLLQGFALREHERLLRERADLIERANFERRFAPPSGLASRAASDNRRGDDCFRSLQLPHSDRVGSNDAVKLTTELKKYVANRPNDQWVIFDTGGVTSVTFLLAAFKGLTGSKQVLLRELGAKDVLIKETAVADLSPTPVTGTTNGLPADWIDPAGPWAAEVIPAAEFLARPDFAGLERWVVTLKPSTKTIKVQVLVGPRGAGIPPPVVLVSVMEVCSAAERTRFATEAAIQNGQIETVTGYLNGGPPVPLLAPNTTYTLAVRYEADSKAADGTETTETGLVQQFDFRTDSKAPARLDPWVLGISPDDGLKYHFFEDPVQVVFNDISVIQLFKEYGKDLKLAVRAADGLTEPDHVITTLDPIPGDLNSPFYDFLEALAAAGLLPCVGTITQPFNASFTAPITLRPLMAYTLDIVVQPADPPDPANPDAPITPLFRKAFSTSKFAGIQELINDVRDGEVRHRALTSQIAGLPNTGPVTIATDQDIQAALQTAGEQALGAPAKTGITIYWAKRAGATKFSPHAILVDAAEPLWRTRQEPKLEQVPNQDDPAYERVVPQDLPALEMVEQGASRVARFVHSPSGTRTLAIVSDSFSPAPGSDTITLALHRPASILNQITEVSLVLAAIRFGVVAPWEEDDV